MLEVGYAPFCSKHYARIEKLKSQSIVMLEIKALHYGCLKAQFQGVPIDIPLSIYLPTYLSTYVCIYNDIHIT